MRDLKIKVDQSLVENFARFYRWLVRKYSPEDFIVSNAEDADLDKFKRKEARAKFIVRTLWEKSGTTIFDQNYTASGHPLTVLIVKGDMIHQSFIKLKKLGNIEQY